MIALLAVACGGALGAVGRYLLDRAVQSWHETAFPLGTLVVNVLGSLALGALGAAGASGTWLLFGGTGVCGALTTYSTFAFESWRLAEGRRPALALVNAVGTVLVSVAAAAAGFVLVRGVVGTAG